MRKSLLLIFLGIVLGATSFAQSTPPCNDPPPEQCPCQTTVICGLDPLDDYCLNMTSFNTPFNGFPGCGGNVLNNPNWFSFVAGTNSLSLSITPSNCQGSGAMGGTGFQAAIYEASTVVTDDDCASCNPSTFFTAADALATQCNCTEAQVDWFNLPTTPGFTYYVVIDGCGGDICDIDIDIIMGGDPPSVDDPGVPILPPAGFVIDTVCPGAIDYNMTLDPVFGAGFYRWTIDDGSMVSSVETFDPELLYTFPGGPTSYGQEFDFCVRALNECGASADSMCWTLVIAPLDTVYDPDINLCEGDVTNWRGVTIGPYNMLTSDATDYITAFQMDAALFDCEFVAAVNVNITNENDEDPVIIDTVLCQGESINIFGTPYSGDYTDEPIQGLTMPMMCDSFIELTMVTLNADATYNANPPVDCSFPGMFMFTPSSITLEPSPNDPNTSVRFDWFRTSDDALIYSAADDAFFLNIADFLDEEETFELFITMFYMRGAQIDSCAFGPFELMVDLKDYIPSTPVIEGPDTVCVGAQAVFTAIELRPEFVDPDAYFWTYTDFPTASLVDQTGNMATIQFNDVGAGEVCVRVQNTCFEADSCFFVNVIAGPQAGMDDNACSDSYTFAAQQIGASMWSTVTTPSGTAIATFSDDTDPNAAVTVNEFGTYQFSWGMGADCSDDIFITFLDSIRMVGSETYNCDNTNTEYTIEFTVMGGLPPYSVATGNGSMTGDMFTSDPILSNNGFSVIIEDAAGCQSEFIFNPHECSCETEGGTMAMTLLESCGEFCHQATSNLDTMMDGNDVAEYILHDQPGASITTVLARNTTGEFCFINGTTQFDVTYYISLVIGDDAGGGMVDLTEGCTRVAPGQPVIWREIPVAAAVSDIRTCNDSIGLLATPSVGVGTWSQNAGPGTLTFTGVNNSSSFVRADMCGVYMIEWKEDNNGCADSIEIEVEFLCNPEVLSIQTPCNGTQTAIDLTIELQSGTEPYTEDFGRGSITGSTFTILDLPLNTPDTFYFTDANTCQLVVPVDIGDCSCITESGDMSSALISDCQDGVITLSHDPTNVVEDANDTTMFYVHTRIDDTLGTVIAINNIPEFRFSDGPFVCDSIFYVSAVSGNWTGTTIDLNDPCLNVSIGQPLLFDCEVIVNAGPDFDTCDLNIDLIGTSSTGNGTWSAITAGASISAAGPLTGSAVLPGPGQFEFEFSASNGSCAAANRVTVTVPESPTIVPGSFSVSCNSDNDMYTVSLQITGGDPSTYTVIGLGTIDLSGNFTSNPIASGDPFDFQFFDQFDCLRADTAGSYTCPCVSTVGDMQSQALNLCEEETVDASIFYDPTNEMTDTKDVLNYILSDNQADPISNILAANTTGVFGFNAPYVFGTTYYISVIIGDPTSPNTVDINDPCLSVSGTLAVTWFDRIDMFEIDTSAAEITCQDPQVTLSILTGEDLTGYDILWTSSAGGNIEPGDETLPMARVNTAGTYTLTISHPLAGCAEMRSVVIGQSDDLPVVEIAIPDLLTCAVDEVTVSGQGSSTGPDIEYEWNGPGIIGSNTGIDIVANAIGVYTLRIINTSTGCEITGNETVGEDRVDPVAMATATQRIDCDSDRVTVSGVGSAEGSNIVYSWVVVSDTGNIVSGADQRDMVANVAGTYELTVFNTDNGCSSTVEVDVEEEGNLIRGFSIEPGHPGCAGVADGTLTVFDPQGGIGPYMYSFDNGLTFSSNPTQGEFEPGTYSVIVRDASGCEVMDSATLNAPFDFFVDLGEDQIVELGESVSLMALTNLPDSLRQSIVWRPLFDTLNVDALIQEFTPAAGQYSIVVEVSNVNGCIQEDRIGVFVRFEERVYVPSAMHPGGLANDNNYLNVYANPASVASISRFEIFDRWGNRVFQRSSVPVSLLLQRDYAWDGTHDGQDAAPGVYTYFVELEYVTGVKEVISGGVTLMR